MDKKIERLKFVEKEAYEAGFADFFERNIKPKLEGLEDARIKLLSSQRKRIPITVLLVLGGIVLSGLIATAIGNAEDAALIPIVAASLASVAIIKEPEVRYRRRYKSDLLADILKFFPDTQFFPSSGIDLKFLNSFNLLPRFDSFRSEDYVVSKYKDIQIYMCETICVRKSGKNKIRMKGKVIAIPVKKKFTGRTFVLYDLADSSLRKRMMNVKYDVPKVRLKDFERIHLEDSQFESIFDVYGSDQIESRYLLTTAFMERLMNLSKDYGSDSVRCAFNNGYLLIYVKSPEDLFEPKGLRETVYQIDDMRVFLKQMNDIHQVVEVLNMHEHTGL